MLFISVILITKLFHNRIKAELYSTDVDTVKNFFGKLISSNRVGNISIWNQHNYYLSHLLMLISNAVPLCSLEFLYFPFLIQVITLSMFILIPTK